MSRTIALVATLVVLLASSAFADNRIALSTSVGEPAGGRVLGRYHGAMDTYGINLAIPNGVHLRDLYEVRRHDRKVCNAIVVYAGPRYSMVVVKGGQALHSGDRVVYVGHLEPYHRRTQLPTGPTVFVTGRMESTRLSVPGAPSFSLPTIGFPSFSSPGFSTPGAPSAGFSSASFGTPGFSAPGFSAAGFSPPTSVPFPSFSTPSASFGR